MSKRFDPGSFRDPDGRVFHHAGEIFRTVTPERLADISKLSSSPVFQTLVDHGLVLPFAILPTSEVDDLDQELYGTRVLRQRKIPFVSYPSEWSFEMLRAAALATLRITSEALDTGWILKDATPFNIVFEGCHPRFVDILSFIPHRAGRPWLAYGQFCRGFLYPLLIAAYKKIDPSPWLLSQSAEIPPCQARAFFGPSDWIRPGVFKDVLLAALLDAPSSEKKARAIAAQESFPTALIKANLKRLTNIISELPAPHAGSGVWDDYAHYNSYDEEATRTKKLIVDRLLSASKPHRVLDIGCNSGVYSHIAARYADTAVLCLDSDRSVIDHLYGSIQDDQKIYPLVGNLAHPTPATGWALAERPSLLTRIKSDFVLALAVIHHLRITANVPFRQIIAQIAALAPEGLIEWVEPSDEMAQRLMALRDCSYPDYSVTTFRETLNEHFEITLEEPLKEGKRRLFGVRRRK